MHHLLRYIAFTFAIILTAVVLGNASGLAAETGKESASLPAAFDYDPGVDYGLANIDTVLFSLPNTGSVNMAKVKAGEILLVVPYKADAGWRYVVDYQSGLIGWVKSTRLDMQLSSTKQTPLTFVRHPKPEENSPLVTLRNDATYPVRLRLDDQSMVIPATTTRAIVLSPGLYTYIIAAAQQIPQFGTRAFDPGYAYTWSVGENSEPVLAPNPRPSK